MRDEDAVARVRNGDRDAYRALVDRYTPMVFGVVTRYCDDEAGDAEDLAQEVFIKAYEGLSDFRGDASFSSWLYTIAVNRCRDHVKSARQTRVERLDPRSAKGDGAALQGMTTGQTPETELERRSRAVRLREALAELDPAYAVPFLLKYEHGLSYEELAERLDATAGALKVRVHRARKALRDLLGDRT